MNTAVINFKTDPELKSEAKKVASDLGVNLSMILNNSLKEFVDSKKVSFAKKNGKKSPYGIFAGEPITEKDIEEVTSQWDRVVDELT